ncbi:hypothetical protein [Marininema halotolerans]|uniref:Tetratricopeptide repeat-containing protein n=1 Tax=Marininema halotolerans TaxID=1155944 RepID=A0A1I6RF37_9BACL|nr:hypothetical protein [Marininema halotolerans]SFS63367.1 hypothetical protein SAMN05444972_10550 [Marininema halotolerans]
MLDIEELQAEARLKVAHLLPNTIFEEFDQPNARMLIAVTLMNRGEKELAYELFKSISLLGPSDNENRHFAYVRSLIEMAEMDAEKDHFVKAEDAMAKALEAFPESMDYMMSKVHLEVYHSYYRFKMGELMEAHDELEQIIQREIKRFDALPLEDGQNLIGPGLCYAIHQKALFYGEEGSWERAVNSFDRLCPYATWVNDEKWKEGQALVQAGQLEEGFSVLVEAIAYEAG